MLQKHIFLVNKVLRNFLRFFFSFFAFFRFFLPDREAFSGIERRRELSIVGTALYPMVGSMCYIMIYKLTHLKQMLKISNTIFAMDIIERKLLS